MFHGIGVVDCRKGNDVQYLIQFISTNLVFIRLKINGTLRLMFHLESELKSII
jgi:hypothetical protein